MKPTDAERDPAFDRLIARGLEGETDVSGNACPDADLLAAWFDRSLSASEVERIEAHASSCAACQQILADLARSEPEVVRAAPIPEPRRPWLWHWRWLLPVATVLVVAVGLGARFQRISQTVATVDRQPEAARQAAPPLAARSEAAEPARTLTSPAAPAPRAMAPVAKDVAPNADRQPAPLAVPVGAPPRLQARADEATAGGLSRQTAARPPDASRRAESVGRVDDLVVKETVAAPVPRKVESFAALAGTRSVAVEAESRAAAAVASSPSGKVVWRVGAAGRIERSTDGRASWQTQTSGIPTVLIAASSAGDSICWAVGASGAVLRTTDGVTWERLGSPTEADLLTVDATSADSATVKAADGVEYSTSDGGRSWHRRYD